MIRRLPEIVASSGGNWPPERRPGTMAAICYLQQLPGEIQQQIWLLSLESRIIDVEYSDEAGFYSRVGAPAALQVSRHSRQCVSRVPLLVFQLLHRGLSLPVD